MNNFLKLTTILIALFLASSVNGQVYNYEDGEGPTPPDSVKGLYVGLNLGFYFANKNTASIYNGYGYIRDGTIISNFSDSWLNQVIKGNTQNINRTTDAMDVDPGQWEFTEYDMPGEMTYRPSIMFAGHLRYMFNSDFGVFTEIGGTFPVTVGQFTILSTATTTNPAEVRKKFVIRGEEQRMFINLGIHRVLGRKAAEKKGKTPTILPYFDLGTTVTFTKFEANLIDLGEHVENFERIVDITKVYNINNQYQYEANILTGMGIGGFGSLGMQITLGRKFTIDLGYVANLQQIKLGEINEFGLVHQFVLKAIYM